VVEATDWSDDGGKKYFWPLFILDGRRTPGANGTYRFRMKCLRGGSERSQKNGTAC
jgi:hypothetical protein